MSFNHSASNCTKSLLIIGSNSAAKVMSKQCSGAILVSLFFSDKAFQSYSFGWKIFFESKKMPFESFHLTNERFSEC